MRICDMTNGALREVRQACLNLHADGGHFAQLLADEVIRLRASHAALADARARITELEGELAAAKGRAEYWKAEHRAANEERDSEARWAAEHNTRAIAAEEREARLREVLREVEWNGWAPGFATSCPSCYAVASTREHRPDCKLHSALADAGAGNQSTPKGDDHLPQLEAENADSRADSPLGADDHNQTTPKNTPNSRAARGESEE